MNSGPKSGRFYGTAHISMSAHKVCAASFSPACYGLLEAVRSGDCCHLLTVTGIPSTNASLVGVNTITLSNYMSADRKIAVWNTSGSIVQSCVHIRVRQGRKKNGGQEAQALGRSRGGFSTKLHITVDALGNGLRFILTSGATN